MSSSLPTDKSRAYSSSSSFNLAVLISGSGTNLQALIDACGQSPPPDSSSSASNNRSQPLRTLPNAKIVHVVSNRREAQGISRAQMAGIPTSYHNLVSYKKNHPSTEAGVQKAREQYDADLAQIILTHVPCPDLVVCAGWMHILSDPFITALQKASVPIINLHPALPGQFNGANAISRAYEAFQRGEITATGIMVHHVISEVDMGEPVIVKEVEFRPGETQSELEARLHEVEWKAIVEGTGLVLADLEQKRRSET